LHGLLYKRNTQSDLAIEQFRRALSYNPFLWPAHEHLSNLGEHLFKHLFIGFVFAGADEEVKTHLQDLERKVTEAFPEDGNTSPNLSERTRTGQHNNLYQNFHFIKSCFRKVICLNPVYNKF